MRPLSAELAARPRAVSAGGGGGAARPAGRLGAAAAAGTAGGGRAAAGETGDWPGWGLILRPARWGAVAACGPLAAWSCGEAVAETEGKAERFACESFQQQPTHRKFRI